MRKIPRHYDEARQRGIAISMVAHLVWFVLIIVGLPSLLEKPLPPEPMAISVEILPITGITNIKPSEKPPAEQEKPEPQKEQTKPSPPVKASPKEETAPPKTEKAPDPVKKEEKKEEKKKEEPKKEEKKKEKEKEPDLSAVLKAVKDTAKKEKDKENKEKPKDSGTSKSQSQQYDDSMPMSLSEKDAIRSQIAKCWNVPAGAKDAHELIIVLKIELEEDGTVLKVELANVSKDRYSRDSFFRAAADSAIRAVRQCSPLQNLPPEKYGTWRDMEMTFNPQEMLF